MGTGRIHVTGNQGVRDVVHSSWIGVMFSVLYMEMGGSIIRSVTCLFGWILSNGLYYLGR